MTNKTYAGELLKAYWKEVDKEQNRIMKLMKKKIKKDYPDMEVDWGQ